MVKIYRKAEPPKKRTRVRRYRWWMRADVRWTIIALLVVGLAWVIHHF